MTAIALLAGAARPLAELTVRAVDPADVEPRPTSLTIFRANVPDVPVTGEQYEIAAAGTRAVVTGVGAGLRAAEVDGAAIVESFDADMAPPMGAGAVLLPWPNRLAGARFTWRGREYRPEVTEPARGHAIHGLVRHRTWAPVVVADDEVTLAIGVPASEGWPQPLRVETRYTVSPGRLWVTHAVTNTGDSEVPVGVGAHPYLRVGDVPVGDCRLTVAADRVVDIDEALVPTGTRAVTADEDLRSPRRVADLDLDTCFGVDRPVALASATSPAAGLDAVLAELRAPDGAAVRLVADPSVRWVQVFTPASPFRPDHGPAVAVEPMTCQADALHSGVDLHVLEPGAAWSVGWGLDASWGDGGAS